MQDPSVEFHNCFDRPIMLAYTNPHSNKLIENIIAPGHNAIIYDQRIKVTAMVRELTPDEFYEWTEYMENQRKEREKENAEREIAKHYRAH